MALRVVLAARDMNQGRSGAQFCNKVCQIGARG
jgi:hypothetical protein